jgi:hypothetical protein
MVRPRMWVKSELHSARKDSGWEQAFGAKSICRRDEVGEEVAKGSWAVLKFGRSLAALLISIVDGDHAIVSMVRVSTHPQTPEGDAKAEKEERGYGDETCG